MATWPSTLPSPTPSGYQETLANNSIRTEMETGPAKVRKRSTAAPVVYRMSFEMDNTDVNTLETFFNTTINDGADSFDMNDPRNGTSQTFRIIGAPEITAITGTWFRVNITMEKLP